MFFRRFTLWGGTCSETTSRGRISPRSTVKLPRTALFKRRTSLMCVLFACSAQPSRVNRSTSLRASFTRVSVASHNLALKLAPDENANVLLGSCFRLCEYEPVGARFKHQRTAWYNSDRLDKANCLRIPSLSHLCSQGLRQWLTRETTVDGHSP